MKKDLTNRRVVNSIGIGILAVITSGTPVLAAINNAMSENDTVDPAVGADMQTETADAAATQNAEIIDVLTDTQNVIQNVQDELNQQGGDFGDNTGDNSQGAGDMATPPAGEGTEGGEVVDPQPPTEAEVPSDGTQPTEPGESQPPVEPEAQPGENTPQTTPEDVPPTDLQPETSPAAPVDTPTTPENVESVQPDEGSGTEQEKTYAPNPAINEHLENAKDAIGNIKEDIKDLDKENKKAEDAVAEYNEAVANPNNYIGSIVGIISDASSAVTGAVTSVSQNETVAKDQAQAAVDAQAKRYESSEEAAAAKQQAQEAAAAAEEAYKAAQATVEEAENNKRIADENLAYLKSQKDEAEAALEEVNARVQDAQEKLKTILASYGINADEGTLDLNRLAGDAKVAYDNALEAVRLAESDLKAARERYEAIAGQVEEAANSFRDADEKLGTSKDALQTAKTTVDSQVEKWKDANYEAVIQKYNENVKGTDRIYFSIDETKQALDEAEEAFEQAKAVSDKADEVLDRAKEAAEAAKNEEVIKAQEAAEAAEKAEKAIRENADSVSAAIDAANVAKDAAKDAADKVERALKCVGAADKTAEQAGQELVEAENRFYEAQTAYENAKAECEAAEEEFAEIQRDAFEAQMRQIKDAQDKLTNLGGDSISLAIKLVEYKYIIEGESVEEICPEYNKKYKRWEVIVKQGDETITYTYIDTEEGLKIERGTKSFITEQEFNETAKKYDDLLNAETALSNAEARRNEAEQAKDYAAVISAMIEMKDALREVQLKASELVTVEEGFEEKSNEVGNKLVDLASKLLSGGKEIEEADDTLTKVQNAQAKVEEAINALIDLSAQTDVDSSAYDSLVAAYDSAVAEHAEAVRALKESITGLDSTERQKNRAKAAADAEFYYNSVENENPTTPTQPGTNQPVTPTQPGTTNPTVPTQPVNPIQPVYGTLIDTVTTPIIANRGVPTGTGYTGYTYTIGGQPVYTVGETTAPEEETADELVNVEDSAVPLAAVGENNKNKTTNTKNTRAVSDEKIPLDDMKTENNKASWWWILVIALLGATGTEMYIRHKEKTEQERKSKAGKQSYAKI